jgi:hypothetical protein
LDLTATDDKFILTVFTTFGEPAQHFQTHPSITKMTPSMKNNSCECRAVTLVLRLDSAIQPERVIAHTELALRSRTPLYRFIP